MGQVSNKVLNLNLLDNNETSHANPNGSITGENVNSLLYDMIAIPDWGMQDFVKERIAFRRQGSVFSLGSPYGEPGTFFYKAFFNFNTSYGLFGGIINTMNGEAIKDVNSARQFLMNNSSSERFSQAYRRTLKIKEQYLVQFARTLNYLTSECPWFFKDVSGLDEALKYNYNEIVGTTSKKITLSFNQDAVDMRISTLLDLYKEACFDYANHREIIPDNLRKFDMCIMLFNPPINDVNYSRGYNADSMDFSKSIDVKAYLFGASFEWNNGAKEKIISYTSSEAPFNATYQEFKPYHLDNIGMSFKCIYLKNCEIILDSINSMPNALSNETGTKPEYSIDISFDRHYIYNVNKELGLTLTDAGMYAI